PVACLVHVPISLGLALGGRVGRLLPLLQILLGLIEFVRRGTVLAGRCQLVLGLPLLPACLQFPGEGLVRLPLRVVHALLGPLDLAACPSPVRGGMRLSRPLLLPLPLLPVLGRLVQLPFRLGRGGVEPFGHHPVGLLDRIGRRRLQRIPRLRLAGGFPRL